MVNLAVLSVLPVVKAEYVVRQKQWCKGVALCLAAGQKRARSRPGKKLTEEMAKQHGASVHIILT